MAHRKSNRIEPASPPTEEAELLNYGTPYQYEPNFEGPVKKRNCTDVLCLLIFLGFIGAWAFVAFFGMTKGDMNKVLYPTDSMGRVCGHGDYSQKPFLLFFDLTQCLNPAVLSLGCPTPQVCVEECPSQTMSFFHNTALAKELVRPYCDTLTDNSFDSKTIDELIAEKRCPPWTLASKPVLGRCMPTLTMETTEGDDNATVIPPEANPSGETVKVTTVKQALTALGAFLSVRDFGERFFNDLSDTWWIIGLGFLLAAFLSFMWIFMMRWIAGLMVWASIGLIFVLVTGLFGYCLYRYQLVKDVTSAQISILQVNLTPDYLDQVLGLRDTWLAFTCILGIIASVILLVLIALRQRIQIAIQLLEQGAKAVGQIFSSVFWPLVPFAFHVAVVVWFAVIALHLSSAGEEVYTINYVDDTATLAQRALSTIEPPEGCYDNGNCRNPITTEKYRQNDTCLPFLFNTTCMDCPQIVCQFTKYERSGGGWFGNWMTWFNLFAFFWTMEFVTAFGEMVLAGVFASWYWTFDKSKVPCCSIGSSFCHALTFHLGTVAFGSLIIAIIRFVRTILQYVESKLKAYQNDLTKCLFCLCKCCLWCLEKFMRFINRNAYIMCAIKSTNFCTSAKDAFSLLMRNIVRVVVLNNVVNFLLFIGKLVIVTGVGILSYFVFSGQIPDLQDQIPTLNYLYTPIAVIVVGSYFITSSFFSVYAMAVDTLFLCFLEDLERNDGTPQRPYFMSVGLQKVVGKMQKFKVVQDPKNQKMPAVAAHD